MGGAQNEYLLAPLANTRSPAYSCCHTPGNLPPPDKDHFTFPMAGPSSQSKLVMPLLRIREDHPRRCQWEKSDVSNEQQKRGQKWEEWEDGIIMPLGSTRND